MAQTGVSRLQSYTLQPCYAGPDLGVTSICAQTKLIRYSLRSNLLKTYLFKIRL